MWNFIPKCQFLPFRVCFISGSRAFDSFFVELGAATHQLPGATISQISSAQQQVHIGSLFFYEVDNGLQGVVGIHAQQSAAARLTEMGIS